MTEPVVGHSSPIESVAQTEPLTRYKTGGYGAMVESETGRWVSHADAVSVLTTMTAHRDALASALRALTAVGEFAYWHIGQRRNGADVATSKLNETLNASHAALCEHADKDGAL